MLLVFIHVSASVTVIRAVFTILQYSLDLLYLWLPIFHLIDLKIVPTLSLFFFFNFYNHSQKCRLVHE